MAFYGFIGFCGGFIAGLIVNAYLLQGKPREQWLKNKSMRLKYGALNWVIAFIGLAIGLAIAENG